MSVLFWHMAIAAVVAALIVLGCVPFVKQMAFRFGAIREVRNRDSHDKPMPLWGGLAMFIGFLLTVVALRPFTGQALAVTTAQGEHPILGILVGASIVAFVGLLDDKMDLKPYVQAGALLLAGFIAAQLGARIDGITNPFAPPAIGAAYNSHNYLSLGVFAVPVTMLWFFIATKTFDFLDGLDGLASGVCAIAAGTMGVIAATRGETAVALMAAALAGACIGFLRYNYNPASIFMGTIGSFVLGFVLAGLALVGTVKVPTTLAVVVPLLVLGVPVLDGFYVAARRLVTGKNPLAADKTHIHHRLRDRGLSVRQAVWAIYGITAVGCLIALFLVWNGTR